MPAKAPVAALLITNQDELPGLGGNAPHLLFVNKTTYSNTRFQRTYVLSFSAGSQEVHLHLLPARPQTPPGWDGARAGSGSGTLKCWMSCRGSIHLATLGISLWLDVLWEKYFVYDSIMTMRGESLWQDNV